MARSSPTTARRLAIGGTSNGGLLVGAALNQRPDLFAAAVAEVGLFDMLRYDQLTGGRAFVSEYGSAAGTAPEGGPPRSPASRISSRSWSGTWG